MHLKAKSKSVPKNNNNNKKSPHVCKVLKSAIIEPFRHIKLAERDKHWQKTRCSCISLMRETFAKWAEALRGKTAWLFRVNKRKESEREWEWTKVVRLKSEKSDGAVGFGETPLSVFRLHEKPQISEIMFFYFMSLWIYIRHPEGRIDTCTDTSAKHLSVSLPLGYLEVLQREWISKQQFKQKEKEKKRGVSLFYRI